MVRQNLPRVRLVFLALITANILAWAWAWSAFSGQPTLLGTALLAWVFGLRHAVDPDHIAAIDNVVRAQMQVSPPVERHRAHDVGRIVKDVRSIGLGPRAVGLLSPCAARHPHLAAGQHERCRVPALRREVGLDPNTQGCGVKHHGAVHAKHLLVLRMGGARERCVVAPGGLHCMLFAIVG